MWHIIQRKVEAYYDSARGFTNRILADYKGTIRISCIVFIVLIAVLLVKSIVSAHIRNNELTGRLDGIRARGNELTEKNELLKAECKAMQEDPIYIEQVLRRQNRAIVNELIITEDSFLQDR